MAQQVEGALLSHPRDIASGTMVARRRCVFWCVDADTRAGEPVEARAKSERSRLLNLIQREGIYASLAPDGRIWLDGTTACALPLVWHTDDRSGMKGVPDKQTLERLVCAAMAAAYQGRAEHVQDWLDNRPPEDDLPPVTGKSYAWSYMAGWAAQFGVEGFLREAIWQSTASGWLKARVAECPGGNDLIEVMTAQPLPKWMPSHGAEETEWR